MMKRSVLVFLAIITFMIPAIALSEGEVSIDSAYVTSWIIVNDPAEYSPAKMIDGDGTTSYQFSTNTTPLGQAYIYFYLKGPSDISTLWIKNGFQRTTAGYDQYVRNSRVKTMTVTFQYSGNNGYYDALTVTLPDDTAPYGWTRVDLGLHKRVTSVCFVIKEIYVGSRFPNDVCISEVKFTEGSTVPSTNLYGLAKEKLATRKGPGTQYDGGGTYSVAGQYIKILSRAWDSRNSIWWVKCEIPYKGEIRVLWTGYWRFDSSTISLESIPIENGPNVNQNSTGSTASRDAWVKAYQQFFTSGAYKPYIRAVDAEYSGVLSERDTQWDCASLYDMDSNGIPELLIRADYGIEQADVFTYSNGQVIKLGTIGGDNFFQNFFYYPNANVDGLFVASGGTAMRIRKYKLYNSRVSCTEIGKTVVDSSGEDTIGIRMSVDDNALYTLLYNTFVSNRSTAVSLPWHRASELKNSADWLTLFSAVVR